MKTCFFMGHREGDERLNSKLEKIIKQLIAEEQVSYFYVGGYGGFDGVAASAVKRLKQYYPQIALMLVLPYHPAERPAEIPPGFDGTYYPDGLEKVPRRFVITRANETMARNCDWLVAYVWHGASNSGKILDYAKRRGVSCININEMEEEG